MEAVKWVLRLSPILALLPFRLDTVLRYSGSDKENFDGHNYGKTYHRLLRKKKYRRIRLLEIGIGGEQSHIGGESLVAWRCYFPFARIIGCDIYDKTALARRRLYIHVVDQSSKTDLKRLASAEGPFDVIIDDGSHINSHQLISFQCLFPYLKDQGIYVIEDVQTSYWKKYDGFHVSSRNFSKTCMGYFCELAKYLNHIEFENLDNVDASLLSIAQEIETIEFEHNLIIIHKSPTLRQ